MENLFDLFYQRLPVKKIGVDEHLHLLNDEEMTSLRNSRRKIMFVAAALASVGFLTYYLPVYFLPDYFPSIGMTVPGLNLTLKLPWSELLWAVFLTSLEMLILVFLNIYGVHETAVATGFITGETNGNKNNQALQIGLEKKAQELSRYGIDPFQGMNKLALFLFNLLLRLKGLLASQAIRYSLRLLLGRYAMRAILDFSGMPLYMFINAYSVHAVMREARVIIMGQTIVKLLMQRLPVDEPSPAEKDLIYDTLQYIAISKRDFHHNHYFLTRELLDHFRISAEDSHQLPENYLDKLKDSPAPRRSLCELIILLGFILDGQLSWRERSKLRELNAYGIITEKAGDLKNYVREFLDGAGIDRWSERYISRIND